MIFGSAGLIAISPPRDSLRLPMGANVLPRSRLIFEPPARGGVDDVRIGRMKSRAAGRVAAKLRVVDHAPVAAAIFGDVGGAHVAVEHHQVRVGRGNRRREHAAAAGKADGRHGPAGAAAAAAIAISRIATAKIGSPTQSKV